MFYCRMVKDCGQLGSVLQYNPADKLPARTLLEHVNRFKVKNLNCTIVRRIALNVIFISYITFTIIETFAIE